MPLGRIRLLLLFFLIPHLCLAGPKTSKWENYDSRQAAAALSVDKMAQERKNASDRVRERLPGVRIEHDSITGAAKFVASTQEFLTGPNGEGVAISPSTAAAIPASDEFRGVKGFLNENRGLFGHGAEALDGARIQRNDTSAHNGMRTVVWQQLLDGIPVFEGVLKAHITKRGELVNIGSQFVSDPASAAEKGISNRLALQANPAISAQQAIAIAAKQLSEDIKSEEIQPLGQPEGAEKQQHFKNKQLIDPSAVLTWLPMDSKTMRLCWNVVFLSKARSEMFRMLVDAETGEVLLSRSLTENLTDATYRVFTSDSPTPFSPGWATPSSVQPAAVAQVLVKTPALDTTASPNGWINDGGNETIGNNVDAHLDVNGDNVPDTPRPYGSPARVFDFPVDTTQDPSTTANRNAAVVQLFYWCNWMHDKLYALGFTESAGNFQTSNFGRGGAGNDAVLADAQDGSGTNNANFSTPTDGNAGRMQMYLFTGPTPRRDACFDAEVVLHEYTHGLSNRLVGGGVGMSALQSRGMGEGWSDFYAASLLSEATDNVDGNYASGGYSSYQYYGLAQNYYFGIRRYPYTTDMTKNPLTFKDIDPYRYSSHSGIPTSPILAGSSPSEVHNQGEVWCVTLWEARANLVKKYGWTVGNKLILQIVTDGMKLSPANPTFLQARDAIIQADMVDNGGANKSLLWAAFAKRGMGTSASGPANSTTTGVTEAYDVPDDFSISPVTALTATGAVGGPFTFPQSYTLTNSSSSSRSWSASCTQSWLKLTPNYGTLSANSSVTITPSISSGANTLQTGIYSDVITIKNLTTSVAQTRSVNLWVGTLDWFTELFSSSSINDTHHSTFTFTPTSSGKYYTVTRGTASSFPTDPSGGAALSLSNDSCTQILLSSAQVSLYGTSYSTLYIGSNGYITFGSFDTTPAESLSTHFSQPRVAALFDDLDPGSGGSVSWRQLSDRVAVTWQNVPEYGTSNSNNFQIEMFFDGRIRITLLAIAATDGLIGLSQGLGLPSGFISSDFSSYPGNQQLALTIPGTASEDSGVLVGSGTVTVTPAATADVTVSLACSDLSALTLPSSVTIPTGQTTATFDMTVINDSLLNGTRPISITASATGYAAQIKSINITDDEMATLSVLLPESVTEGSSALTGTVTMNAPAGADVLVSLNSSNPARATVPLNVTIPSGKTSATFSLSAVDDNIINGTEEVTVTAHVDHWTDGSTLINVLDNETKSLALSIPSTVREGDATNSGTVQIPGTLDTDLVVTLNSNNTDKIQLPATVTIPAGKTSATFVITIKDNTEADGSVTVTVSARAVDFTNAAASLTVLDNDPSRFEFAAIAKTQIRNLPFPVSITAYDRYNKAVPDYSGTVTLSARGASGVVPITPTSCSGFVNGVWTGNVSIDALDSSVVITAVDGVRHSGSSNAFDVGVGSLDHFGWSPIASPQQIDNPFAVTITAQDIANNLVSSFSGTVDLSAIVSIPNLAIGSGSDAFSFPMCTSFPAVRTQVIYLASELGGAADFTAISFNVIGIPGVPMNNWTVRIKQTSLSAYSSGSWDSTGWTTVCQQTLTVTGTGWVTIPFSTPFHYDGVSNLMVDFSFNNPTTTTGSTGFCQYTNASTNRVTYGYSSVSSDPLTWAGTTGGAYTATYVPNVRFSVENAFPITPGSTGAFVNGSWTGNVSIPFTSPALKLLVEDKAGYSGTSGTFSINATTIPGPTTTSTANQFIYFSLDSDPGWTREGEWAFGVPAGQGGLSYGNADPSAGNTGANVFGINLNGDYATVAGTAQYLTTGALDCTGRTAVKLQFQRWLNADTPPYAILTIEASKDGVNWTSIWNNTGTITDSAWTKVEYDISSVADNQPTVYIRWSQKIGAGAYAYSGWNIDDIALIGTFPLPTLEIAAPAELTEGASAVTGTVSLPSVQSADIEIALVSTAPAKVTVPASVRIPAGQLSAEYVIKALDDSVIDGTKTVGIIASASGFNSNTATVQVFDNDFGTLRLDIPSSAHENCGTVSGTLTLSTAVPEPVQVTLNSSDSASVQVPTTVTIPLGQTSVPFTITMVDNKRIDGQRNVTISAHIANWADVQATILVLDDESNLILSLPPNCIESGSATGTVSIGGVSTSDLTISLESSVPSRLVVPATATIAAGNTSATFSLVAPDNSLKDGMQSVDITASATNFTSATGSVNVLDNDVDHFSISAIGSPQFKGIAFGCIVAAKDSKDVTVPTYSGTLSLNAACPAGSVSIAPTTIVLSNGTWNGNIVVNGTASGAVLTADDGNGLSVKSNAFNVLTPESMYDAFSCFSTSSNPVGNWQYGYKTSLTGTLSLSTVSGTTNSNTCGYWSSTANTSMVMKNFSGSDYADTAGKRVVPGSDYLLVQPGASGEYAVVRWTAATSGTYQLVTSFKSLQTGTVPATTDVHIFQNSTSVFDGTINSLVASSEQSFSKQFIVSAGNTIDLVVGPGTTGTSVNDATGLKASMTPINPASAATTLLATNVRGGSAILNSLINPAGLNTSTYFEYGPTIDYGTSTAFQFAGSGSAAAISGTVVGLAPNTVYHYRAVSVNTSGTNFGLDQTLTTLADGAVYDLFDQFCTTSNPSPDDRWRYGWTNGLGGSFSLLTSGSVDKWSSWSWGTITLNTRNLSGVDVDSYDIFNRPGDTRRGEELISTHPGGSGELSVSRWTAPVSGTYQISAAFANPGLTYGASTDVHVLQNSVSIFNGSVNDSLAHFRQDFLKTVRLSAGDTIDFAIGAGSNGNSFDSTTAKGRIVLLGNKSLVKPALNITPSNICNSTGSVGGPFTPSSQVYTLVNTGTNPLNWTLSGSSSWLTFSSTAGSIASGGSATLTTTINAKTLSTGTYVCGFTITDTTNGNAYIPLSSVLKVLSVLPPSITSSLSTTGTNGSAFSYQITAANSPTSYNAVGLPAGLSISSVTGLISGTPTQTGAFDVIISASNAGGASAATLALDVLPPLPAPVITSALTATGTNGSLFSYQITATNYPTSYGAANLPATLSINSSTGLISGTLAQSGTFKVPINATNTSGTGAGILLLTVHNPLYAWKLRHFTPDELANESISGDEACPLGDGVPNLIKYALHLDPKTVCVSGLPIATLWPVDETHYLSLTYTRVISATDIVYTVEVSGDMRIWDSGDEHTTFVSETDNGDGVTTSVIVRDLTPLTSSPKRFIRLKVTKP